MTYLLLRVVIDCLIIISLFRALIHNLQYLRYLWNQIFKPRELGFRYSASPRKPRGKTSHSYRTDPKNRQLQTDLLNLLQGDVPTAKRLLQTQRRMHPGKTDNWYLEKVIYDIVRDRH